MGTTSGVCGRLSSSWDGQLADPAELLQWAHPMSRDHLDAAAGGAFFSKTVQGAVDLIEKMVSNMGWSEERLQTHQRGMQGTRHRQGLGLTRYV